MATRGGRQEQLARRLFVRARFGPNGLRPSSWWFLSTLWRLVDPLTRTRFRARARELLAEAYFLRRDRPDVALELDIDFTQGGPR